MPVRIRAVPANLVCARPMDSADRWRHRRSSKHPLDRSTWPQGWWSFSLSTQRAADL